MNLLSQVLIANLVLITGAVMAASLVARGGLADESSAGMVLALAIGLTVAVNVLMLQNRFRPLEELVEAMENADLRRPSSSATYTPANQSAVEVERLSSTFHKMLERLEAERRRSSRIALAAQEEERARVARDLHDEVNQSLTGLLLHLEAARSKAPPELAAELDEIRNLANGAMEELLRLARQLRPSALDDLGLKAALAGLVEQIDRQSELDGRFEASGDFTDLESDVEIVAYRIAQEAISNVVQHSEANAFELKLSRAGSGLEMTVTDDGHGIMGAGHGHGIPGMQERAILVDGEVELDTHAQSGTTVRLRI